MWLQIKLGILVVLVAVLLLVDLLHNSLAIHNVIQFQMSKHETNTDKSVVAMY